LWDDV
jgi:hypothetical protein